MSAHRRAPWAGYCVLVCLLALALEAAVAAHAGRLAPQNLAPIAGGLAGLGPGLSSVFRTRRAAGHRLAEHPSAQGRGQPEQDSGSARMAEAITPNHCQPPNNRPAAGLTWPREG